MSKSSECRNKQRKGKHDLLSQISDETKLLKNNCSSRRKSSENKTKRRRLSSNKRNDHDDSNSDNLFFVPGDNANESMSTGESKTTDVNNKGRILLPVRVSCIEIFNEDYRDLLSRDLPSARLEVVESPGASPYIDNVTTLIANEPDDINEIITLGNKNRVFGATASKPQRISHSVYTITTETIHFDAKRSKRSTVLSHFHLVDMAGSGSEQHMKFETRGKSPKEGGKISLPLYVLRNTFSAVDNNAMLRMQYKRSTVMKVLGSLIDCKTETSINSVEGVISLHNHHKTISKKKKLCNKIHKSKRRSELDKKDVLIRRYKKEIKQLEKELKAYDDEEFVDPYQEYSRLQAEQVDISKKVYQLQIMLCEAHSEQKDAFANNQKEMKRYLNKLHYLKEKYCCQETLIKAYIGEKYKIS